MPGRNSAHWIQGAYARGVPARIDICRTVSPTQRPPSVFREHINVWHALGLSDEGGRHQELRMRSFLDNAGSRAFIVEGVNGRHDVRIRLIYDN